MTEPVESRYQESWIASQDYGFQGRVLAASTIQANTWIDHTLPEFNKLAKDILSSQENARVLIAPTAAKPGITIDSPDEDLNAAIQAVWPLISRAKYGLDTVSLDEE